MKYQFGDQDLAARRLEAVGRVFESTTRELMHRASLRQPRMAIDLGCGPGFTTRLLAEVVDCAIVGLDTSERFLARARKTANSRVQFHRHDVLTTPFPAAPADLLFAAICSRTCPTRFPA